MPDVPLLPLFTPGCGGPVHPGIKGGDMGVSAGLRACFLLKKRSLLWNEVPYFADLTPIAFVFTFVCLIILDAFSKAKEGNMLFFNYMIKMPCFRSDIVVIGKNVMYHCL